MNYRQFAIDNARDMCRVSIDELNHDLAQYGAEDDNNHDDELKTRAHDLICDGDRLHNLIFDYEINISRDLSRIMRELEAADANNPISREAVLDAAMRIRKILMDMALKEVS